MDFNQKESNVAWGLITQIAFIKIGGCGRCYLQDA
jgi:hypothetical protein